ncbi:MAG: molybdopterin biosynthesis protein [Deltaproteobacteria bacterium]|nr:molybdopterin biosynthesis protein [Deltaproteobacteria bacterium]MBW2676057.1 molybdopterin biosynthesis protein [Deltaproteobacteria bacterium]
MKKNRNVYLKMKTLAQAREIILTEFQAHNSLSTEIIPVQDSVGRTLAQPVTAELSSPHFHAAAMDGVAVAAASTFGANPAQPIELQVNKDAFYVNTGHVLPDNTDAVIMIEHLNVLDEHRIQIEAPVFPWQHVRKIGEDIVATELLFPRNHVITPYCLGALITGGIFKVPVKRKPRILIIPTGSELVDWRSSTAALKPGQVLESNSYVIGNLAAEAGADFSRSRQLMDDPAKIRTAVQAAVKGDVDIVLTVGGSSAGSEDYTKDVIIGLGEVLVHGVTIMPGKPVIVGKIGNKPIFGIPGYPVSAIIAFEQFVKPLIDQMRGQPEQARPSIYVEPTRKVASKLGLEEFVRVKLGTVGSRVVATALPRGAGCITSITEADGIIRIPEHMEGLKDNQAVKAELIKPAASIDNTIVAVGSHDNTLDVLADELKAGTTNLSLSSSHVGSMGGLMAVKRGACHIAGSHLLDTENGTYNVSYLDKYMPGRNVRLVNLVMRDQGLIVPRGNAKGISSIEDLARDDLAFINRQGGSGTRILLDYKLGQLGLDPARINGYDTEEYTHMSVAVAVLSGTVDVGLGIFAAARALDLDFIPVVTEQYDLVIPQEYFESEKIQALMDIINTDTFKTRVESLGGYSTEKTGQVII